MAQTAADEKTVVQSPIQQAFARSRDAGVPLVAVQTPDQWATIYHLRTVIDEKKNPVFTWDQVRGLRPVTANAKAWIDSIVKQAPALPKVGQAPAPPFSLGKTVDPTVMLDVLDTAAPVPLPQGSVVFMLNAHLHWHERPVLQGISNLRDKMKDNEQTLVLLTSAGRLPIEIVNDVVLFQEKLPGEETVRGIITQQYANVADQGVEPPTKEALEKAIDATIGLSAFSVEQVAALSMRKNGLDIEQLWERKISVIEQTRGLNVWQGKENRASYAGANGIVDYVAAFSDIRVVCYIDEIEKGLAGAKGDLSGVSQDQLGTLLTWTEDQEVIGILLVGAPGTGKTLLAKVAGNLLNAPTVKIDLGAMQGSLVGESQQLIRNGLSVVDAVAQGKGRTLLLATCNQIDSMPPELIRRFKFGVYYFDLLTPDARDAAWKIHMKANGLAEQKRPDDTNWTGAEIRACCQIAARTRWSLVKAAERIVCTYKANPMLVERLREQAQVRGFIDAATGRPYVNAAAEIDVVVEESAAKRKITLPES